MDLKISPLAPTSFPDLPAIEGVRLSTAQAGIKYKGRTDVLLVLMDEGTRAAGVFTRSMCPSAPVEWCREKLADGAARALLVNSGNANAFTGLKGRQAVEISARDTGVKAGVPADRVFLASTGVIGEPLAAEKFAAVLEDLVAEAAPDKWRSAAEAIMTTDTFPKLATARVEIDGVPVTINGVAKGSGMIAPDMATMLGFLFTDLPASGHVLQKMLADEVGGTFNAITVDSDTSTSDTVMLFATGKAAAGGVAAFEDFDDPRIPVFRAALRGVMEDLAHQIVRDGEGATKFVKVTVTRATDTQAARKIAFSIANSPLVKTAIAGEDANWGRVVMAVGKAGQPADRDRLAIWFGDTRVAVDGERDPAYDEDTVSAYMKRQDIELRVDLGLGDASDTVWTCDLTKAYVEINGDYRT